MLEIDSELMRRALKLAQEAATQKEVPVGAVFTVDDQIIGEGHNRREQAQDPLAHAEILAIGQAAQRLGNWRLGGTLYVTLEPCPMCLGALLQARVNRLVFGCRDPKAGAVGSIVDLTQGYPWNHKIAVTGGVLEEDCRGILQDFFRTLR